MIVARIVYQEITTKDSQTKAEMVKIALFGTSADPPTAGHKEILNWLSQHFDLVAVWASDNPFKSHASPLEHRSRMLKLLIEEIKPPRQNIHLYPEISNLRTIVTVQKAKALWPSADLSLVIGSDLVFQQPQGNDHNHKGLPILSWYRVEDLLRQVHLLVVPRPGYPMSAADLEQLDQLGAKVAIADLAAPAVSSTAYREHRDPTSLTPPVKAYIHQKHLYECQDPRF